MNCNCIITVTFAVLQGLDDMELEEEKKDLINREIRSFRNAHKVRIITKFFFCASIYRLFIDIVLQIFLMLLLKQLIFKSLCNLKSI